MILFFSPLRLSRQRGDHMRHYIQASVLALFACVLPAAARAQSMAPGVREDVRVGDIVNATNLWERVDNFHHTLT